MANIRPSTQFYPGDWWRAVDLRKCCMATQGIWFNMLLVMWDEKEQGKIRGTQDEICRITGCEFSELERFFDDNNFHKFANVTFRNKKVTIINRRMHNAYIERERVKKRVSKHREKRKRKCNTDVTPYSSSSTSTSCNNTVTYMNPTLQDCYNSSVLVGITDEQAKKFYEHYKPQGWIWGNGQPMVPPLQDCLVRWRNNGYKFEKPKQKESISEMLGKIDDNA